MPDLHPASHLLLLLALGVGLLTARASILGMLLGGRRVFFALRVIAFSMVFSCGAVGFGRVFVMFGGFVVLVSSHEVSPVNVWGDVGEIAVSAFGSSV